MFIGGLINITYEISDYLASLTAVVLLTQQHLQYFNIQLYI
jgi:hypothetical protein